MLENPVPVPMLSAEELAACQRWAQAAMEPYTTNLIIAGIFAVIGCITVFYVLANLTVTLVTWLARRYVESV